MSGLRARQVKLWKDIEYNAAMRKYRRRQSPKAVAKRWGRCMRKMLRQARGWRPKDRQNDLAYHRVRRWSEV